MRVYEILQSKGNTVYQISPAATLADAVEQMVNFNCGSLLVSEGDLIVGIITERLILRAINSEKQSIVNYFAALGSRQLNRFEFDELKQFAAHLNDTVANLHPVLADLKQAAAEHEAKLAKYEAKLAEHEAKLAERDAQLNAIYTSHSWRLTKPLRFFTRLIRGR